MQNKEKKHRGLFQTVRDVWFMFRYTFRYAPGYIWITLIEAFGRAFDHILSVLFVGYLFDAIEARAAFTDVLYAALFVAVYRGLFELFNKWMLNVYRPKAHLSLHEGMQSELYQKARSLDQACYDDPAFYNDFIRAISDADSRTAEMMIDLSIFLNRIISGTVIFSALIMMDWIVGAVLIVTLVGDFVLQLIINRVNYEKNLELDPVNRRLGYIGRIFYMPEYAKELRQGQIGERMREQYVEATEEKIGRIKRYAGKLAVLNFCSRFLVNLVPQVGITVYMVARLFTDPLLSLGVFSAGITAAFRLYWIIHDIGNYLNKFNEHSLYISRFYLFLAYEPKITGVQEVIPAFSTLELRNLSFQYPSSDHAVLRNVNIKIERGEKVAFVGYNGAGKTTLTKLLMRLYDPAEGAILYNGQSIRTFSPEHYRHQIGAVFQDYKIFAATVAENVLGNEYTPADEARVLQALQTVGFSERLVAMPWGIHTSLTREFVKDGVALSGGEAQKIVIARVFAKMPDLIILDEPSSALDPVAEYQLNQSIHDTVTDKTVVYISHRLSSIQFVDRIYMFDGGEIVESGSHEELMRLDGKYAHMYRAQAAKYWQQVKE